MSTRLIEKEEKILQILSELAEESEKGTPIIVEGKKDVEALRALGVKGTVLSVKTGGKSFLDIVTEIEQMDAPEVILLLDFDRRGKEGTKRLRQNLETAKIKANVKFWHALSALVGKEIQCVESLNAYLDNLRAKIGVSARHGIN